MADYINVLNRAASLDSAPAFEPYTGVRLWYDDEHYYFAGDESGRVMEADQPWATQAMADGILTSISGFRYQPFEAGSALLDMEAELGDGVNVGGVYSLLASVDTTFGAACASDLSAPAEEEVDNEYPYQTKQERELGRRVALGASYHGTRITRQNGLEIVKTDDNGTESARVKLNSDTLAFYDASGDEALYFDAEAGKYTFRGMLNVNDNFIVDADGNLTLNGSVTWGTPPIRYQYSVDNQNWHDTQQSGDIYRRESIGGGSWGAGYQFVGTDGQDGSDADVPSYITSSKITEVDIESPTITGNDVRALKAFSVGVRNGSDFDAYGHFGLAHGKDAADKETDGVAMACAGTISGGVISYDTNGQYVIVTNSGVRMQAQNNNIVVTGNGAYLAVKDGGDNVVYRLALDSDGLHLDEGSTRRRILTDGDTVTPVWG